MKKFDLNIDKILESWQPYHAIREIIANAMDEQLLTGRKDIEIYKQGNAWIIRDYGRGLEYSHLTQKENAEKVNHPNVIGRFGIGLKDALATLYRHDIDVKVRSRYADIALAKLAKASFDDVFTLHALISPPKDESFVGTEFIIEGIDDSQIFKAKHLFLNFADEVILENTNMGDIIQRKAGSKHAYIYINGVKVAEEENFLFSYNITSITTPIRRALNRERTNVGRTAYSDTVKRLLLSSESELVAELLAKDLNKTEEGTQHDELRWLPIQFHAVQILNASNQYLFITANEASKNPDVLNQAKSLHYKVIYIPGALRKKIRGKKDKQGKPIIDLHEFIRIYESGFQYEFVKIEELSPEELKIWHTKDHILDLFGGLPIICRDIRISNTMRKDLGSGDDVLGVWDAKLRNIIIRRDQLRNLEAFAGTLIHEAIHAKYGLKDVTREFESFLTLQIGRFYALYLENKI